MSETIDKMLKTLKLSGISKDWRAIPYQDKEQYLSELLSIEIKEREVNRINRLTKTAGFRVIKTMEAFDWNPCVHVPDSITRENIERLSFVNHLENLIFLGAVGTGKTHLATAIALKACESGKQVRFFTAAGLSNTLLDKSQKGTLNAFLSGLKKVDLMVIDEIGFVPLHRDAAELLFQVISDCYEKKSLIITSNLEFSQWNTVFGDNRLTAALIDRLIHHSHIFVFTGESYRLTQSMKKQKMGDGC